MKRRLKEFAKAMRPAESGAEAVRVDGSILWTVESAVDIRHVHQRIQLETNVCTKVQKMFARFTRFARFTCFVSAGDRM